MSISINLEIGHDASLRTKTTPEGFTHDWEVYVKGCNGAEIHYYVEKVVFFLHETFPKPKRVVKEPPYSLRTSGYAGFNLPIEIYLRNNQEPKKIRFNYDLQLQPRGPPIHNVQKEKYIFHSSSEDFRSKLLKGGGIVGSLGATQDTSDSKVFDDKAQMTSKPKLSGSDVAKKHKIKLEEPRNTDFVHLFGTPITKTTSKTPEPPKPKDVSKSSSKTDKSVDKDKSKTKSPHKDKEKSKSESSDKKKDEKKKSKDDKSKDRIKEKSSKKEKERDKSPSARPRSPSPKRSPKRPMSPPPPKHSSSKEKDQSKDEKKEKDRKEEKKSKKEKREHKDSKHKDREHKEHKSRESKSSKESSVKDVSPIPASMAAPQPMQKTEKKLKEKEPKDEDKVEKVRSEKSDDKQKHKHKKKDRKEKRDEKHSKSEKKLAPVITVPKEETKEPIPVSSSRDSDKSNLFGSPKSNLFGSPAPHQPVEKVEKSANNLVFREDETSNESTKASSREPSPAPRSKSPMSPPAEPKKPEQEKKKDETFKKKDKKEKKKDKKSDRDHEKKRKRKSPANHAEPEQPPEKISKEEENNNSDDERKVSSTEDANPLPKNEQAEDYMGMLRDLQHKIMGLKDNSDLQKVVQLIAETGRYEVSAHTFDFDLCLLDRSTVRQLQDFFSSIS